MSDRNSSSSNMGSRNSSSSSMGSRGGSSSSNSSGSMGSRGGSSSSSSINNRAYNDNSSSWSNNNSSWDNSNSWSNSSSGNNNTWNNTNINRVYINNSSSNNYVNRQNNYVNRKKNYKPVKHSKKYYGIWSIVFFCIMLTISLTVNYTIEYSESIKKATLDDSLVKETGYYEDEIGWIEDATVLYEGMKYYYQKTGVQPYLYLTDSINSDDVSEANIDTYCDEIYNKFFEDEGHTLVVYIDDTQTINIRNGKDADAIIGDLGIDLILKYLHEYWTTDMSADKMFSEAFHNSADDIMKDINNGDSKIVETEIVLLMSMPIFFICFIYNIIRFANTKSKKKIAAEANAKVKQEESNKNDELIHELGNKEVEELKKKYDNMFN